jgi:hypothetical protein
VLDTTFENNFTAFSIPYNTSVMAVPVLSGATDKLTYNMKDLRFLSIYKCNNEY